MCRMILALVVAVMALGADALAQEQGQAAIGRLVASGAEVSIYLDGHSSPMRARIVSIGGGLLTVVDAAGGSHMIALANVARIERDGDANIDGALIGAAAAGGLCIWTCRQGARNSGHHKQLVLGNALMFGFFGWLIDDKRQGTTVVYRRERRTRVTLAVSPAVIGLEVRLRLP